MEGSLPRQHWTSAASTGPVRPEAAAEPPTTEARINKITVETKRGDMITAESCEESTEQETERILLEPIVNNTEDNRRYETRNPFNAETIQFDREVRINSLTPEQQRNIIQTRVLRDKVKVRARIVAQGCTEAINDLDEVYASAPVFDALRTLVVRSHNWTVKTGDLSAACLHASISNKELYMARPRSFTIQQMGLSGNSTKQFMAFAEAQATANAFSRRTTTTWIYSQRSRTQRLHAGRQRLLRNGVRRRYPVSR